jgi:hypothetical protein
MLMTAYAPSSHRHGSEVAPSMKVASVTQCSTDKAVSFDQHADDFCFALPAQAAGVYVQVYRMGMHQDSIKATGWATRSNHKSLPSNKSKKKQEST